MALILGAVSGIDLVSRVQDEKTVVSGVFQLQTQSPAEYWTVKVTPDDVEKGVLEELKKHENPADSWSSKPIQVNVQAKQTTFNGQKFFSFVLDSIPAQNQKAS